MDDTEAGGTEVGSAAAGNAEAGNAAAPGGRAAAEGRRVPRRLPRGRVLVVAGILVVAAGTVGALGLGGGGHGGAPQGRADQVVEVTRGTLTDRTEIDGQLGYGPEVSFQIKATGTVTWLPEVGTVVRRGGTVLRVDDRPVVLMYGSLPMFRGLGLTRSPTSATGDGGVAGDGDGGGDTTGAGSDGGTASGSGGGSTAGRGPAAGAGGAGGPSGTAGSGQAPGQPAPAPLTGMDVLQFETNLRALGYSGFTVDEEYTELTAAAVKRWQRDLGVPQTGTVGMGDIVYAPAAVRVAGSTVPVGAEAAGSPLSYTGNSRLVTVAASAAETSWARRGTEVAVDLPDGRTVRGTVLRVGKEASAAGGAAGAGEGDGGGAGEGAGSGAKGATVSVVIGFRDQKSLGRIESGPVTVRYVSRARRNVLTVPVSALVALAEGGYALETAADGGTGGGTGPDGRFIAVRTGLFADGRVEVGGPEVREGLKVRIPQ